MLRQASAIISLKRPPQSHRIEVSLEPLHDTAKCYPFTKEKTMLARYRCCALILLICSTTATRLIAQDAPAAKPNPPKIPVIVDEPRTVDPATVMPEMTPVSVF